MMARYIVSVPSLPPIPHIAPQIPGLKYQITVPALPKVPGLDNFPLSPQVDAGSPIDRVALFQSHKDTERLRANMDKGIGVTDEHVGAAMERYFRIGI